MTAIGYADTKRIHTLDIMSGIALLGILIINVQTYTLFAFLRPDQVYILQLDQPGTYAPLQCLIHLFINDQFYALYSFLFGIGFYVAWQNNERLGLDGNRIYKRRLWWLLLFGLVHAFVFWFGDVLHKYALLGFTLLYFNKKEVPVLIRWMVALALFAILFLVIKTTCFPASSGAIMANRQAMNHTVAQVIDTWQYGSVSSVISLQKTGVALLLQMSAQSGFRGLVQYEIMFLLGLTSGKINFFYRIGELKPGLKKLGWSLLPVALSLKAVSVIDILNIHPFSAGNPAYESLLFSLSGFIAVPLLTLVYLIFFSLAFPKKPSRFWRWIANTGCAGLTNYLAQTAMCMVLFYGYAFGLAGHVTLAGSFVQVILIYALQVLFSNLWLKDHTSGPAELLWQRMTYGKKKKVKETPVKVLVYYIRKNITKNTIKHIV